MSAFFPGDSLQWNESALERLLLSEDGPVARELVLRAQRVENQAKVNASGRPGPNVRSGRLRASISWRIGVDGLGIYVDVGTAVPYGFWLETGLRNGARYPFLEPAIPAFY